METLNNNTTESEKEKFDKDILKNPESFRSVGAKKAAELAIETLKIPDIMIRDELDPSVYRYYKRSNTYFMCVIAKHLNEMAT